MKRILLFFLFFVFSLTAFTQGLHVKFTKPVKFDSGRFYTLEGEILPVTADRKGLILWEDTVKLPTGVFITLPDTSFNNLSRRKHDFVKSTADGMIRIDVRSLGTLTDTVFFICENREQIPLYHKKTMVQPLSSCGQKFRLVIPGASTVFYTAEGLTPIMPPVEKTETAEMESPPNRNLFKLASRYTVEIGLILAVFILGTLIIVNRKKLEKRFSRRKRPHTGSGTHRDHAEEDGMGFRKEAFGLEIADAEESGQGSVPAFTNNETGDPKLFYKNAGDTQQFLQGMEHRILQRIDSIHADQSDFRKLNEQFDQTKREKNDLKRDLEQIRNEKQQLQKELEKIHTRVIPVEFLKNYCGAVADVFIIYREIVKTAYDQYRKKMVNEQEDAEILGQLLLKFEYKKPPVVGKWEQMVQDIRESGTTSNPELIRSFRQVDHEEDKIREFKRQLFDMLTDYSSAVLILAEELKNFSRFTRNGPAGTGDMEDMFNGLVSDLLNKVRTTKLEVRYVPLFVKNAKYSNFTKVVNQRPSRVYNAVFETLEKDSVAEIVSYGFSSEFGKTETQVILT
jgi:hypothetical protein